MELKFKFNGIYKPVFTSKSRYIDVWGGRARGGSHFGTDYFLFSITQPHYFRGCFMRDIFGDIRDSLWKDFNDRIEEASDRNHYNLIKDFELNESRMTAFHKPTGNLIISKGFKKSAGSRTGKLKSLAGMTNILIEETEEIVSEDDFNKLDDSLRTTKTDNVQIMRLWNPPSKNHWLIKRNYNLVEAKLVDIHGQPVEGWYEAIPKDTPDLLSIHSNYENNWKYVAESTKQKYKNYGDVYSPGYNPDFYYRDVLGLISEGSKGRILTHVKPISYKIFRELPYPSFFGLDWGFNDPNAVLECKYHDGKLFWHELVYKEGMDNEELMIKMRSAGVKPADKVYYDSARPDNAKTFKKGIEYGPNAIKGFNMIASLKGADSIMYGIRELKNVEIFATDSSTNLWYELEEYHWQLDANKEPTDVPGDDNNHLIDAGRYAYVGNVVKKGGVKVGAPASNNSKLDWIEEYTPGKPVAAPGRNESYEVDEDDLEEFYK